MTQSHRARVRQSGGPSRSARGGRLSPVPFSGRRRRPCAGAPSAAGFTPSIRSRSTRVRRALPTIVSDAHRERPVRPAADHRGRGADRWVDRADLRSSTGRARPGKELLPLRRLGASDAGAGEPDHVRRGSDSFDHRGSRVTGARRDACRGQRRMTRSAASQFRWANLLTYLRRAPLRSRPSWRMAQPHVPGPAPALRWPSPSISSMADSRASFRVRRRNSE